MAIGSRDEARPLQLVERGEAVAVLVLVDVEDVRARRPGRDGQVGPRLGPPPVLDLLVAGGGVQEAVLGNGPLPARLGREHMPAGVGVAVRGVLARRAARLTGHLPSR